MKITMRKDRHRRIIIQIMMIVVSITIMVSHSGDVRGDSINPPESDSCINIAAKLNAILFYRERSALAATMLDWHRLCKPLQSCSHLCDALYGVLMDNPPGPMNVPAIDSMHYESIQYIILKANPDCCADSLLRQRVFQSCDRLLEIGYYSHIMRILDAMMECTLATSKAAHKWLTAFEGRIDSLMELNINERHDLLCLASDLARRAKVNADSNVELHVNNIISRFSNMNKACHDSISGGLEMINSSIRELDTSTGSVFETIERLEKFIVDHDNTMLKCTDSSASDDEGISDITPQRSCNAIYTRAIAHFYLAKYGDSNRRDSNYQSAEFWLKKLHPNCEAFCREMAKIADSLSDKQKLSADSNKKGPSDKPANSEKKGN